MGGWHHRRVLSPHGDDLSIVGWDVVAVGQRQSWPFITFAAPTEARSERTLWIDTDFTATDSAGGNAAGTPLARLEPFVALIVRGLALRDDALLIEFDDSSSLSVSNTPNDPSSQGWWMGRTTDG